MPRGDRSSYTDKQKRNAEHIEEGYGRPARSHPQRFGEEGRGDPQAPRASRRFVSITAMEANR
jgi:hypothetical protein